MAGARRRVIAADDLRIVHDLEDMDIAKITDFILGSYWGGKLSADQIRQSLRASFCVGLLNGAEQIAFARAISDTAIDAYLKDVIVFPDHRRQGHGRRIVQALMDHPALKDVPKWYLGTKDAHAFYQSLGFKRSPDGIYMNLTRPQVT